MILGSAALAPMVRALLPKAEIIGRPRFSTLSYAGPSKLSRLPPRSAIVAFSAEQVYAVAEMLRRMRGGAAVVMGALSPRTRNAQVAMYQAGEVDYLVATDAIGMGLNMDVTHVAFAGLSKYRRPPPPPADPGRDGADRRPRRPPPARRQLRLADPGGRAICRIPPRGDRGDRGASLRAARPSLLARGRPRFPQRRGPGALARAAAGPPRAPRRARGDRPRRPQAPRRGSRRSPPGREGEERVRRLWAACGLPDFRKTGADLHARLVARIYTHLSEGDGRIPQGWYAEQVARLDHVQRRYRDARRPASPGFAPGPISPTAPTGSPTRRRWRTRTGEVEEKLSDALHERLTQRFVDRRTSVLMRDIGGKGVGEFPVIVDEQGEVSVGSYPIGRMEGFAFEVDPAARHADRKMLLATAERRLGGEYEKRAAALAADTDQHFTLAHRSGPAGRDALARPRGRPARPGQESALAAGEARPAARPGLRARPRGGGRAARPLGPAPGRARARAASRGRRRGARSGERRRRSALILAMLVDEGGIVAREQVAEPLAAARPRPAPAVTGLGIRIGALDLFMPEVLKPEAMRWRTALRAAAAGEAMPELAARFERRPRRARRTGERARPRPARLPPARPANASRRPGRAARPPRPRGRAPASSRPAGRRGARHLARPPAAGGGEADARPRLPPVRRRARPGCGAAAPRPRAPSRRPPAPAAPSPRWRARAWLTASGSTSSCGSPGS